MSNFHSENQATSYPQVVRIFATVQDPDYDCPWQSLRTANCTGSGVLIRPNEILTGAHVIANSTFLKIQKNADPNKTVVHVKSVCHDCDLALLTIEDQDFLKEVEPATLGEIPNLRDKVSVVGFPIGGEEISITEGVVSRIEVQQYSHSQRKILAVTVDAAINKGNSGGPVFKDGKIAGIAFQKLNHAENIGEMVPANIIRHFLKGIDSKKSPVVPALSVITQKLENPLLRKHLSMKAGMTGVMVKTVAYGGSAWGHLNPGDVLLEIEGASIANNGTILYLNRYRTRYDVVLGQKYVGDTIQLKILRQGKIKKIRLKLQPLKHLVPYSQYDQTPSYFIFAGLVFQPLTYNFLNTWEEWWDKAPPELLYQYYSGNCTEDREEVILVTQILSDEINVGYENLYNECISTVNGEKPRHIQDFVEKLEKTQDSLELRTSSNSLIILEMESVKKSKDRILKRYHIMQDRSQNLR
ncbi:MAG: serine protease [Planctomycetota bacterium]